MNLIIVDSPTIDVRDGVEKSTLSEDRDFLRINIK